METNVNWSRLAWAGSIACTMIRAAVVAVFALPPFAQAADIALTAAQSDCLFSWAETDYPLYFAPSGMKSSTALPYYYRYYPQSTAYLATSSGNGHLYYLGPATGNTAVDIGEASKWLDGAGCSAALIARLPDAVNQSATSSTGTGGGTTTLGDGTSIAIPAGAVSAATQISLTKTNSPSSNDIRDEMQPFFERLVL